MQKTSQSLPSDFLLNDVVAFTLDKETEVQIKACFSQLNFEKMEVFRGDVKSAVQKYSRLSSPSLIIVDISNSELPLSDLENLANVCAPDVRVIVVGTRDTVGLYRSLLNYGVTDYLVKPIPTNLLLQTLERIQSHEGIVGVAQRIGTVIGVYGACGGVGSTSILNNLSDILARELHRKVMLVDLNLCLGDLWVQLGLKPGKGLSDLLTNPERVDNFIIDRAATSINERLDLLRSEDRMETAITESPIAVSKLTERLRRNYHFVMLDVMRGVTLDSIEILKEADVRLIIFSPSIGSLHSTKHILMSLGNEGDGKQNIVVLNQVRPPSKADLPDRSIEQFLQKSIDYRIPYDGRSFSEAILKGIPVSQYGGKAAHQIRTLSHGLSGPGDSFYTNLENNIMGEQDVWQKILKYSRWISRRAG